MVVSELISISLTSVTFIELLSQVVGLLTGNLSYWRQSVVVDDCTVTHRVDVRVLIYSQMRINKDSLVVVVGQIEVFDDIKSLNTR